MLLAAAAMLLAGARPGLCVETVSYNRDVRPILSDNCFQCHGFDPQTRHADLRLDTREGALGETGGPQAVSPGSIDDSELWRRINSAEDSERMPPPETHKELSPADLAILKRWIEQGALYEPHWSFVPLPDRVETPLAAGRRWPRNAIDTFVLASLDAAGLEPNHEASRERWLRRVTFDLTGLPPSQAELGAFLQDASPMAFERVVDRLLASPHFGERMAVPWLDAARYADSFGYQADVDMHAWPYRDWVVDSLNDALPWDEFITWQIAGDLLPGATREQRLATAFNRIHRKTNEGGSVPEEFRQDGISDRVDTVGTIFLGLTLECAKCHDHKYDPLSQREYYALGAYFNSIDEFGLLQDGERVGLPLPSPVLLLPTEQQEAELAARSAAVEAAESRAAAYKLKTEGEYPAFEEWLAGSREFEAADAVGYFPFEPADRNANVHAADQKATAVGEPVDGPVGSAIRCNGDDAIAVPGFGIEHCHDSLTVAFWVRTAEDHPRAVVFANTTSYDANYNGFELLLEDGHLRWSAMREFPGNAISVRTEAEIETGRWTHVAVTYDGSRRAAGMRIYLDGSPAATEVVRDKLTRDFRVTDKISFGARSRDFGLRAGAYDEIHVFRRAITPIEVAQLCDGETLGRLQCSEVLTGEQRGQLREYFRSVLDPVARRLADEVHQSRVAWRETLAPVREISVMEELEEPRPAYVLDRGAYDSPLDRVDRVTPAALPPMPNGASNDRLGLARWLTDDCHPLTSRVLMNRLWQEFFGHGIVETSENFGLQGEWPSHPELLDWLARDFVDGGWDYKRMCRQIVLSATYRQDSQVSAERRAADPDNRLLARGPSRRLTAEMLRDSALAYGGLLARDLGGPPVKPYQPPGAMWRSLNNFLPEYQHDQGAALHRRSAYSFWRRTTTAPNMMAFDTPSREVCTVRRQTTNTPLQPLVLLNDPQFVEAARGLAARMLRSGLTGEEGLRWMFREVTSREATEDELAVLVELYDEQLASYRTDLSAAESLRVVGQWRGDAELPAAELAAATSLASAILNCDAGLMLR